MALAPPTTFDRDTASEPAGDGAFRSRVSGDWSALRGPNGGYVAAIVLRALEQAVGDPSRAPRSLTCHFLRPPAPGDCETHVTVERVGRAMTNLSARLVQDGRLMVLALAAFATDFPAPTSFATPAPDVGAPRELRTVPARDGVPAIAQRVATARVFGSGAMSGGDEALAGGWLRLAEPRPADAAAVAFYTDAWLPAVFTRLTEPLPAATIDLTIHFRARLPVAGADPEAPLLGRFLSNTARDGFAEEDGELWTPDGTLVAQSRQLAVLLP